MKNIFIITCFLLMLTACKNEPSTENEKPNTELNTDKQKTQTDKMENDTTEYKVKISTSFGDMVVLLYNETPKHRDNFLKLAKQGYFDDLLFHRVMKDFMIQGGDPESKNASAGKMLGSGGPGYTIPAEFRSNLIHKKGALAGARQPDGVNPAKASSGSQFYIVQGKKYSPQELTQLESSTGTILTEEQKKVYREIGGTPFLDYNYTVFGEVISGMEVIDKIAAVQTNPQTNRPIQDVKMTVSVVE